ncbi:MAG: inner membrane CreD family protein [Spirochaetes bacterium]|nr:inner membrane CreD family protein [Spirochaetota bacterium]
MMTSAATIFLGLCLVLAAFLLVSVKIFLINKIFILKIMKYGMILLFGIAFSIASIIIGYRINDRHNSSYSRGLKSVQEIWGGQITQQSPGFLYSYNISQTRFTDSGEKITEQVKQVENLSFEKQEIKISIESNIRKKGLLLYPGYNISFDADYAIKNDYNRTRNCQFNFPLPQGSGNISGIKVTADGREYKNDTNYADGIQWQGDLDAGESIEIRISYKAQGTEWFSYNLAETQTQIKSLKVEMSNNFEDYNIPDRAMVPSFQESDNEKTLMKWEAENIITNQNISLSFDVKGNYGKIVSKMFFYSPLAIFLFIGFLMIMSAAKEIRLHPMHYLFILTGFFIYFLLGSYLMSYMNIIPAIMLSITVSSAIIIYYSFLIKKGILLVKTIAAGLGIFQWVFSTAFFFPQHTGFVITIASILSFIILMQVTSKIDWENKW